MSHPAIRFGGGVLKTVATAAATTVVVTGKVGLIAAAAAHAPLIIAGTAVAAGTAYALSKGGEKKNSGKQSKR